MRSVLVRAFVIVNLVLSIASAEAAIDGNTGKKQTAASKAQGKAKAKVNGREGGPVTASAAAKPPSANSRAAIPTVISPSSVEPGIGTSAVKTSKPVVALAARQITGEVFQVTIVQQENVTSGAKVFPMRTMSQLRLGLNATIGQGKVLSVKQSILSFWAKDQAFPGYDQTDASVVLDDTSIEYVQSSLATFGNAGNLGGSFQLFLPTGEISNVDMKSRGLVQANLVASHLLGKFVLAYKTVGKYGLQTQDMYFSRYLGLPWKTYDFSHEQWASGTYLLSPRLTMTQALGYTEDLYRDGTGRDAFLHLLSNVNWQFTPAASIGVSLLNKAMTGVPVNWGLLRPYETFYLLDLTASI